MAQREPAVSVLLADDVAPEDGTHGEEVELLLALKRAGIAVASFVIVPAAAEHWFYRLNNLFGQLDRLFADVDRTDPDEDDIYELAPEAKALVTHNYLLDEFIDEFFAKTGGLGPRLQLRRTGAPEALQAPRGRPALLALKNLWAARWEVAAIMDRLTSERRLIPDPTAVIVHPEGLEAASNALVNSAADALGKPVTLLAAPSQGITHVASDGE